MQPDKIALAQAVCTRLCHDLGGAIGALAGALDLMDGPGDDAMDVARDASRIMDRRIRFYRAAVGGGCGDCRLEEMAQIAEGLTLGRKAKIDLTDLEPTAVYPAHLTQALMLGAWAAMDALPRGGTVRLGGDIQGGLSIWPDGAGAAWQAGLSSGLAGDEVPVNARSIAVPLLLAVSASAGIKLDLLMGAGGGAAPLFFTLQTRN
ncbi:MAG TPA: histidine phosphotransferase family protein [Falsiroseomonas sp.]|jgi:histidine phosphotransferase ChpT|nr:histidine phosphotransferase family protein [Falsiroseomonas sp.]